MQIQLDAEQINYDPVQDPTGTIAFIFQIQLSSFQKTNALV